MNPNQPDWQTPAPNNPASPDQNALPPTNAMPAPNGAPVSNYPNQMQTNPVQPNFNANNPMVANPTNDPTLNNPALANSVNYAPSGNDNFAPNNQLMIDNPSVAPGGNINPYQGNVASIDYLNSISGANKKSFSFSRKQLAIFGGILLLAFVVLAASLLTGGQKGPDISKLGQQIVVRSNNLAKITKTAGKNIKSNDLAGVNSSLTLHFTNINAGLSSLLSGKDGALKISKEVEADQATTALDEKLAEAQLNSIYDQVYAREMAYEIETLLVKVKQILKSNPNKELKASLDKIVTDLQPIQEQLAAFDGTTGS